MYKKYLYKFLLVMRLTTVILIATIMQVSANSFAQRLTYTKNNATLAEIFKEIRKQTGYNVLWSAKKVNQTTKINVNFNNTPLEAVLNKALADQKLAYEIEDKNIIIKEKEPSFLDKTSVILNLFQDLIKGRVVDQEGKPLPNASIRVKGKSAVTNTNAEGEFEIKGVDEDAVLLVSYVGFKTLEISLKGAVMPLEIKLNVATGELEEVKVVYNTGYQELNKERSTGSFVQIDNELFNRAVGTNVLDRILYVTSGLLNNPNAQSIRGSTKPVVEPVIRGISTINAGKSALVVVDNFPYDGDLSNLNPNDVESITVLKDAAAASIWGVRAGNGVIVITTKKGKFNQLANIGFNSNVMIGQKPDLFYVPYISSKDMIEVERLQFSTGIYNDYDDQVPSLKGPALPQVIEILLAARKKNSGVVGYDALIDPVVTSQLGEMAKHDVRDDIAKYLMQNRINQQYALNLSGGGDRFNYYTSLGYDRNKGYDIKDDYRRLSLNFTNSWRPIKNLEINTGLVYTRTNNMIISSSSYINLLPASGGISPYTMLADKDGNPLAVPKTYRTAYVDTASYPSLLDWHYRPLEDYKYIDNDNLNNDIRVSTVLKYAIQPWLKAEFQYQNQTAQSNSRTQYSYQSYIVRTGINRMMNKNAAGSLIYPWPLGDLVDFSNSTFKAWNARGSLRFDKQFENHQLSAFAGVELRETTNESISGKLYGFDPETYISKPVDFISSFPVRPLGTGKISNAQDPIGNLNRNGSVFGNAEYNYKRKYLATVSGRIDQSNFFGVKANLRRVPLWHAGLAWNVYLEDFYNTEWLSVLKLRASYGYTGNTNSGASSYATFRYRTGSEQVPPRNITYGEILTPNNPQLRWERVKITNIGIDFALKSNRVNGSLDIYRKNGIDLLGPIITEGTTGRSSYTGNQAAIEAKGFDLNLNTNNIINDSFEWSSNLLISFNKDKVTAYGGAQQLAATIIGGGYVVVGVPLSSIYSYKWAGLDPSNGDPRIYLADTISAFSNFDKLEMQDLILNGTMNPKIFGSFRNIVKLNQISISANVTYKFGHYFRRKSINYTSLLNTPGWSEHSDFASRWMQPGDELVTNIPSSVSTVEYGRDEAYLYSNILVEKADHIRLQDIRLDYSLNRKLFKKSPLKQISFYMYATNLGIIWRANNKKLDPDAYEFGSMPIPKTFAFGLNANF